MIPCVDLYGTKAGYFVQDGYSVVSVEDTWTTEAAVALNDYYLAVESKNWLEAEVFNDFAVLSRCGGWLSFCIYKGSLPPRIRVGPSSQSCQDGLQGISSCCWLCTYKDSIPRLLGLWMRGCRGNPTSWYIRIRLQGFVLFSFEFYMLKYFKNWKNRAF